MRKYEFDVRNLLFFEGIANTTQPSKKETSRKRLLIFERENGLACKDLIWPIWPKFDPNFNS